VPLRMARKNGNVKISWIRNLSTMTAGTN